METNVTGFGWELLPLIETKEIKDESGNITHVDIATEQPVDQVVIDEKQAELAKISALFASAAIDDNEGLLGVFKKKTRDLETFVNAYLEIERDKKDKQIIGIHHLRAWTMRLMKKDDQRVYQEVKIRNPVTLQYFNQERWLQHRRFVQIVGKKKRFYKSFGDQRRMNANDGEYLEENSKVTEENDPNFLEATEVIHFSLYHPLHEYGMPRYISVTPGLLSARAAQLLNYELLTNNGIPMGMIVIEGFQSDKLEEKIREEIDSRMKGTKSFHSLLIVQADAQNKGTVGPGARPVKPSIRVEKLSDLVQDEAMFMEFDKSVDAKIVGTFRLPSLLVGKSNEINRATAEVALQIVEEQVFGPERHSHDFVINTKIFEDMGVKYWRYKTKPAKLENLEKVAMLINNFVKSGVVMPREARPVASEVMQHPLTELDQDYMNMPQSIYLAGVKYDGQPAPRESRPTNTGAGPNVQPVDVTKINLSDDFINNDLVMQVIAKLLERRDGLTIKSAYILKKEEKNAA